jgi:DNA replication protein DnaC
MSFDINDYKNLNSLKGGQYQRRMEQLKAKPIQTSCIEEAVGEAITNLSKHETRSFVIYGEPQSGKTEMMIALTARLMDEGNIPSVPGFLTAAAIATVNHSTVKTPLSTALARFFNANLCCCTNITSACQITAPPLTT